MTISRERVLEAISSEITRQTSGGTLPAYALDREALADAVLSALHLEIAVPDEGKRPEELNGSNDD